MQQNPPLPGNPEDHGYPEDPDVQGEIVAGEETDADLGVGVLDEVGVADIATHMATAHTLAANAIPLDPTIGQTQPSPTCRAGQL